MIRKVELNDAAGIVDIYNYYIRETIITFETEEIDVSEMEQRIKKTLAEGYPFFVYEENDRVVGYAYLGKWRERSAYSKTLETSIYMDINCLSRGIGKKFYTQLIDSAKTMGIHVLIGGMSCPNPISERLHESMGFERVGRFKEVGLKFGQYIDVEFWSLQISIPLKNSNAGE